MADAVAGPPGAGGPNPAAGGSLAVQEALNFDLYLGKNGNQYTVKADAGNLGSLTERDLQFQGLLGKTPFAQLFTRPAPGDKVTPFVQALRQLLGGVPPAPAVDAVGGGLYQVLPQEVRDLYNQAWGYVKMSNTGDPKDGCHKQRLLRVRLRFNNPELGQLALLPWEYLKLGSAADEEKFLCQHPFRSLVRCPEGAGAPADVPSLDTLGQLKILVWGALPEGQKPVDFDGEVSSLKKALEGALGPSLALGAKVDLFRGGTLLDLQTRLQQGGYNVLHYIGHADFQVDANTGEKGGPLYLERPDGSGADPVYLDKLYKILQWAPAVRLVFLNACKTATNDIKDIYASLAFGLTGLVPVVIGMQYEILDPSAVTFAQAFYTAFASGFLLDQCVNLGRQALILALAQGRMDWGIPVLFRRVKQVANI